MPILIFFGFGYHLNINPNYSYEWRYCWLSHFNGRDRYRDAVAFRGAWGNEAKNIGKDKEPQSMIDLSHDL